MMSSRKLGLIAAAVAALAVVLAASGSASASVLCSTNTNPCTSTYLEGTDIHTTTTVHTTLKAGFATVTCTEREITEDYRPIIWNKVTTDDYTNCGSCSVTTLKNGEVKYEATSGGNGTLVGRSAEYTFNCSGVSCKFGTAAAGTTLGTITGGSPATVTVNAKLPWQEGDASNAICTLGTGTGSLTSTMTISSPNPLFVEKE